MAKKLITEADVAEAVKRGMTTIAVDSATIVTPSARDLALRHRIEFTNAVVSTSAHVQSITKLTPKDVHSPHASTVIAVGSDHGGYQMKEQVKNFLLDLGYSVIDVGTQSEQACDYPDFAYAVASLVSSGQAQKGIMVDAVGVASAMVANKVPGVRAAVGFSEFAARSSREHNDANVLTLGGRVLGIEAAKAIVKVWLETWFGGGRHQARVQKITDIEQRFRK
ncbi:MAG TPA: ribose 5-phosphate isomerase B [Bacteroidota bacterium]|nr:ribose 5-phosphate isomerase B [Bacteroidota bacterium]